MFWENLPSQITELLSGWAVTGLAEIICLPILLISHNTKLYCESVAVVTHVLSPLYEFKYDPNPDGKWEDLAQREVGILLALLYLTLMLVFPQL